MSKINSFDIDGVIYLGPVFGGLYPGPNDVIITGRSFEEAPETLRMLESKGITNKVYFNPLPFDEKTRHSSGVHKARVINELGNIALHFEDDPIQMEAIIDNTKGVQVVHINHDLVEKENVRHEF